MMIPPPLASAVRSPSSAAPSASRRHSSSSRLAKPSPRVPAASIWGSKARWCSAPWSATPSPYHRLPWLGLLAAAVAGICFGLFHGWICKFPKVNDIAIGIALMQFGTGLAFFFGKPFIQPVAPHLPSIPFGFWSAIPQLRAALDVNVLFIIGIVLAIVLYWAFKNTKVGPDHPRCRRLLRCGPCHGAHPNTVRLLATAAGGSLAGDRRRLPVTLLSRQLDRTDFAPARA